MDNFTPIASTLGGVLIGLSATLMLLLHGRIAGISGIIGGGMEPRPGDVAWRALFLGGLVVGGTVTGVLWPSMLAVTVERSMAAVVLAGLLVGFGTRLGNGCTSGHGVCGISRGSPRSLASVLTFIAAGVVATTALRLLGVPA